MTGMNLPEPCKHKNTNTSSDPLIWYICEDCGAHLNEKFNEIPFEVSFDKLKETLNEPRENEPKCPICDGTGINIHIEKDEIGLNKFAHYPCQCRNESEEWDETYTAVSLQEPKENEPKEIDKSEWKTKNPKLFEYDSNNGNGVVDIFVRQDPACPFPFHEEDWYHQGFYLKNFITYLRDFFKRYNLQYKVVKIRELDDYLK